MKIVTSFPTCAQEFNLRADLDDFAQRIANATGLVAARFVAGRRVRLVFPAGPVASFTFDAERDGVIFACEPDAQRGGWRVRFDLCADLLRDALWGGGESVALHVLRAVVAYFPEAAPAVEPWIALRRVPVERIVTLKPSQSPDFTHAVGGLFIAGATQVRSVLNRLAAELRTTTYQVGSRFIAPMWTEIDERDDLARLSVFGAVYVDRANIRPPIIEGWRPEGVHVLACEARLTLGLWHVRAVGAHEVGAHAVGLLRDLLADFPRVAVPMRLAKRPKRRPGRPRDPRVDELAALVNAGQITRDEARQIYAAERCADLEGLTRRELEREHRRAAAAFDAAMRRRRC